MTQKLIKKPISEILTVMIVDLCKYTEISSKLDKEEFNSLHDTFDSMCISTFEEYDGNIIKKIGDAFLITFKSPTSALECSVRLQKFFKEYNEEVKPKHKLKIKIAIHSGEVLLRDNDVYGEVVNIVSRLASIVPPSGIYLTKAVYLSINGSKLSFSSVGFKKFKGVKQLIHVTKINWISSRKERYKQRFPINIKILEYLLIFLGMILTSYIMHKILE